MSLANGPIKLGRINRAAEKALGLSLTSDVAIYMNEQQLNQLARARPHDYLKTLDQIGKIIKEPDYVRYDEAGNLIYYCQEFIKGGDFVKVAVEIKQMGDPARWNFTRLFSLTPELTQKMNAQSLFVRPQR